MRHTEIWIAFAIMLAAPMVTAADGDGTSEDATWGLCQADEANGQGDESSNGSIEETPPFENLTAEDCENATAPWEGTPGADHVPEDPGQPEDPGAPENPGQGQAPEDPGPPENGGGDDGSHPDQDENPSDGQGGQGPD